MDNSRFISVPNKSFGDILANTLSYELVNHSAPGSSNHAIFNRILRDIERYKPNDKIIVQWSYINRAYVRSSDMSILPMHTESDDSEIRQIAEIYYKHLYDNVQSLMLLMGHIYYLSVRLPNVSPLPKLYYSMVDDIDILNKTDAIVHDRIKRIGNYVSLNGGLRRYLGTFDDVYYPCNHPNELGHEKMAELYMKALTK